MDIKDIKKWNKGEARQIWEEWLKNTHILPAVSDDYLAIRDELHNEVGKINADNYKLDVAFGYVLYSCLDKYPWFNLRLAANDDFWRYLSVAVVPDIVMRRWEKDKEERYFSRSNRIWLKQIWWFYYLSLYDNNIKSTRDMLTNPNCDTDVIENLVDRTGKFGTNVGAYRKIMYIYCNLTHDVITTHKQTLPRGTRQTLFRIVMVLNTARMMVMDPGLCAGEDPFYTYAKQLFIDAGIPEQDLP